MCGPPGYGRPKQAAHLVEGLARGVVEGVAQLGDAGGDVLDEQQRRVAAADDERHGAVGELAVHELVDHGVADHVVDAVERPVERERQRLRRGDAHRERAHEPGPDATAIASTSVS